LSSRSNFQLREQDPNKKPLHPMWTGVGCVLVSAFMVAGYFLADWFLEANKGGRWIAIPPEFAWPDVAPYLLVKLAVGAMVLLLGSAFVSIVFAIVNPPKPGKYDVKHPEEMSPIYNRRK
jgi:hypothetical protein